MSECSLKSLTSPHAGELLQSHNSLTFKLLKTVADFSQALATLHDRFGHELQMLVETFRKRNGELRKERLNCPNSLFQVWELFLQQVEVNSQQHGDISRELGQQIGGGLIERVFHRKIQSKKIFSHKERVEAILLKSNELLGKCYKDYCQAYALALTDPAQYVSEYIASHNVYVHQLQATNGMVHAYQTKTLPRLLEELEECQLETSASISASLLSSSELISEKSTEQANGYRNLALACRQANHRQDLVQFVKIVASSAPQQLQLQLQEDDNQQDAGEPARNSIRYHQFQAANWQQASQLDSLGRGAIDPKNLQIVPTFKNEIAPDYSQPSEQQQPKLEKDREQLEEKIDRFEERIEVLAKLLARSSESRLHNKVNELQEELCQRRFDLYVAQIHLSAVRSQLQLFEYNFRPLVQSGSQLPIASSAELIGAEGMQANAAGEQASPSQLASGGGGNSRRSPSSSSSSMVVPLGYRSKWIKAFKSLKETTPQQQQQQLAGQCGQSGQVQQNAADFQPGDPQAGQSALVQTAANQLQQSGHLSSGQPENQHFFQEYTFKKISSCDVCKDFLRGHMRQGVKCKLCKISCHNDCQAKAHGTIKCQQPKIKLLRRQKSAGELEVNVYSDSDQNAAEPSERAFNSKPDSIYSLIRQVLDAKKRGQHHAPTSQHTQSPNQTADGDHHLLKPHGYTAGAAAASLAHCQLMNLSMGNLARANQNGKSVSTSALLARPESSVDRWSVVMDLLAQSRQKTREGSGSELADGSAGGKRHSKQLDKFKLAARSVGKQQRHQQTSATIDQQQPGPGKHEQVSPQSSCQALQQHQQQIVTQASSASAGPAHSDEPPMMAHSSTLGYQQQPKSARNHQSAGGAPADKQLVAPNKAAQQPSQVSLVHHTKSLPVAQQQQPPQSQSQQHQYVEQMEPRHHHQQHQMQVQMSPDYGEHQLASSSGHQHHHHLAGPALSNPIQQQGPPPMDHQQQHQPQYQLLDISLQQQLQSTSAPHSPQRKRFNLRMKSFSLDSPEGPIVTCNTAVGPYGSDHQLGSGPQAPTQDHHHHHQQAHFELAHQQPPAQTHHNYQQAFASYQESRHFGQQQEADTFYYQQQQQQQQRSSAGGKNNYSSHQAGASVPAPDELDASGPSSLAAGGPGGRHFSSSSVVDSGAAAASAPTYHSHSTLRPSQQQQQQHGSAGARHQQQHRHSYHNPLPAGAYADYSAELAVAASQLMASRGAEMMTARHCASSSALNIHHIPSTASLALTKQRQQKQPAASSKSKQLGSGGNLSCNQAAHHHHHPQLQQHSNSGGAKNNDNNKGKSAIDIEIDAGASSASTGAAGLQNDYYDLDADTDQQKQAQQQQQSAAAANSAAQPGPQAAIGGLGAGPPGAILQTTSDTFVVLYDYAAQRGDELQLTAGQLVLVLDSSERDWWKVRALDGSQRLGYFPSSYLAALYANERPLQVAQTIQVSNQERCNKLLRGQIVIHTGKQLDNFVTVRTIPPQANPNEPPQMQDYIQCPEKYLLEVLGAH